MLVKYLKNDYDYDDDDEEEDDDNYDVDYVDNDDKDNDCDDGCEVYGCEEEQRPRSGVRHSFSKGIVTQCISRSPRWPDLKTEVFAVVNVVNGVFASLQWCVGFWVWERVYIYILNRDRERES